MWRGGGWREKPQRCHCKSVISEKTCANLCTSDPSSRSSAAEHRAGRCPSLPICLCASVTHRQGGGRGGELWPIPWKDLTDPALPLSVLCLYPPIASLASVLWRQGEKCRCDRSMIPTRPRNVSCPNSGPEAKARTWEIIIKSEKENVNHKTIRIYFTKAGDHNTSQINDLRRQCHCGNYKNSKNQNYYMQRYSSLMVLNMGLL